MHAYAGNRSVSMSCGTTPSSLGGEPTRYAIQQRRAGSQHVGVRRRQHLLGTIRWITLYTVVPGVTYYFRIGRAQPRWHGWLEHTGGRHALTQLRGRLPVSAPWLRTAASRCLGTHRTTAVGASWITVCSGGVLAVAGSPLRTGCQPGGRASLRFPDMAAPTCVSPQSTCGARGATARTSTPVTGADRRCRADSRGEFRETIVKGSTGRTGRRKVRAL